MGDDRYLVRLFPPWCKRRNLVWSGAGGYTPRFGMSGFGDVGTCFVLILCMWAFGIFGPWDLCILDLGKGEEGGGQVRVDAF